MKKPEVKAQELFDKFYELTILEVSFNDTAEQANEKILKDRQRAKECAIICVEEILKESTGYYDMGTKWVGNDDKENQSNHDRIKYYQKVLTHIKNL